MFEPDVKAFFDPDTSTMSYLVSDQETGDCIVIDPVLDYDALRCQTSTESVSKIVGCIDSAGLSLRGILETHAHADHLSGAQFLQSRYGAPIGIGAGIEEVQETFARIFNFSDEVARDGSQFDLLIEGGKSYPFGSLSVLPLSTPGHTPACLSYSIGDAVFTGDALFMEDYGTGRTDFPAGSSRALFRSVSEVLFRLPDETRVFVGHDYQPQGRELRYESTIAAQRRENVQLNEETTEEDFVQFRDGRDAALRAPRLIYQSVQVNVFGGLLPREEDNGVRYLRTPINTRVPTDQAGNPKSSTRRSSEGEKS